MAFYWLLWDFISDYCFLMAITGFVGSYGFSMAIMGFHWQLRISIGNYGISMWIMGSHWQLWVFNYLEAKYRLFPPVTIFLDLFLCAGYFFNAFDWNQRTFKKLIILPLSGVYSNNWLGQLIKNYIIISISMTSWIVHFYIFQFRLIFL